MPNWRPVAEDAIHPSSLSFELARGRYPSGRQPAVLIGHLPVPLLFFPLLNNVATSARRCQGKPLRGGYAGLDIAKPTRLIGRRGNQKKDLCLSSQPPRSPCWYSMLLCPSPEPVTNQPSYSFCLSDRPSVLSRTARGYVLVSRTVGSFTTNRPLLFAWG